MMAASLILTELELVAGLPLNTTFRFALGNRVLDAPVE